MGANTVSLRRNSQAPGLKAFYKIMKAQKILWLLFPFALAMATICGVLNGTAGCTIATTSCTSTAYRPISTTITASDCICVPPGNIFRVTNNGLASVTINIIVTGSLNTYSLQTQIIPANSFLDFEVTSSSTCDGFVTLC